MRVLANCKRIVLLSAVLWLLSASVFAKDNGVQVISAESILQGNDYVMSADIDYQLSDNVIEAINNGVPLYWTYQFKVQEQHDYLWNTTLMEKNIRYGIQYHALLKLYRVRNDSNGAVDNFSSLEAALAKLSAIRDYRLIEKAKITDKNKYIAAMKISFERDALPLPLRPVAYMNPKWYLSSDWRTWPLKK